jgi:hypothetical protein
MDVRHVNSKRVTYPNTHSLKESDENQCAGTISQLRKSQRSEHDRKLRRHKRHHTARHLIHRDLASASDCIQYSSYWRV